MGSLPALTLGNLTKIPDIGLYKIIFYEGTRMNSIHSQPENVR